MASAGEDKGASEYVVGDELLRLTREDFLRLVPIRPTELEWRITPREATITIRKQKRGLFSTGRTKKVVFDQVGAFVLKSTDGSRTVQEIGKLLAEAYGLKTDQAELSLIQFLMGLHKRGYIWLKKPPGLTLQPAAPPPSPEAPAMRCAQCGAVLPQGAGFCPQCGAKVT